MCLIDMFTSELLFVVVEIKFKAQINLYLIP